MALLAAAAELAIVRVVLAVAVKAALARFGHGFASRRRLAVTRFTTHTGVFAGQGVRGLSGVVEIPGFPVAGVVAGLATGPESRLVPVVFSVAGHAFALHVVETFCCMTVLAFDAAVASG